MSACPTGQRVSEYRDRLFPVRAVEAAGLSDAAGTELAAVDGLIAQTALGPEWLSVAAKMWARRGRTPHAKRLLDMMSRTGSDTTAGSSTNRDSARDTMYFDIVRGEIALCERRPADAIAHFEAARVLDPQLVTTIEMAIWKNGDRGLAARKEAETRLATLGPRR